MEVGDEGGDGIPILRAAKRSPELQETRQFEESVSGTSERDALNYKPIADRPEGPRECPNLEPPNVARGQGGVLEFGKEVREVGVAPIPSHHLSKAAPNELCGHT